MKEIEVKILDARHELLETKIIALGAHKVLDCLVNSVFFKGHNLDRMMRLRSLGDKYFLTVKERLSKEKAKICNEYEVQVSDFEATRQLLGSLGFTECRILVKKRVSYQLLDVKFEFDTYLGEFEFIPEFLEIEAKSIESIYLHAKILGFGEKDCKPWSWSDLVKHYEKNRNI